MSSLIYSKQNSLLGDSPSFVPTARGEVDGPEGPVQLQVPFSTAETNNAKKN
jgi:hypothetical protein